MKKYHLLLPSVIALLSGCYSELHYQEQAVDSARKFIYENARELTPEQYAFVKLTPPVLFNGTVLPKNSGQDDENLVNRSMRKQVCITWRIPGQKNDYMVFGVTDGQMSNWSPSRLIRRPVRGIDENSFNALAAARRYAVSSLYEQLSVSELNSVRFSNPELIASAFDLGTPKTGSGTESKAAENKELRPWKKIYVPAAGVGGNVQLSLVWKLASGRYAVFCGVGQTDLTGWQIAMAGVFDADEVAKSRVRVVKTSEQYLTSLKSGKTEKKTAPAVPVKDAAANAQAKDVKSAAKGEK